MERGDPEVPPYLTNIGPEVLSAEEVAELYGCRWEVERVFKELKSQYALDRVNTTHRSVAEALIWASWLTEVVGRRLHSEIRSRLPEEVRVRYPPMRWGIAFREPSGKILELLLERLRRKHVDPEPRVELARTLMARALDPNAGRESFRAEGWSQAITDEAPLHPHDAREVRRTGVIGEPLARSGVRFSSRPFASSRCRTRRRSPRSRAR